MNAADFLRNRVGAFKDFSPERLRELAEGSSVATFEPKSALVRQGEEATHFGVVLSGSVAASVMPDGGARRFLGRLGAGETFGELGLIAGEPALADLVAESRCEVLRIPLSLLRSALVAEPRAVQPLSRTLAERLATLLADPASAAAALRRREDPYGLRLRSERPERILVVNCGSSSLKYGFFDTADESHPARGLVERIGIEGTGLVHRGPGGEEKRALPQGGFAEAIQAMVAALTGRETGVLRHAGEVSLVAHRVVHGGERFTEATIVTDEVLGQIEALNPLAPLHNPVNVAGIREMRRLLPAVPHVAVFDTAFHHTLPPHAYLYGLPYELYEKEGVRRYGFHGPSHEYAGLRAAQFLGRRPGELRIVSCHLGSGSSVCAVDHGRSVDTSMGFTPAEGLLMGTRCGDVDAGVLAFLERTHGLTASQSEELLNKRGGLLGLSGVSSDMREILRAAGEGHPRAILALQTYAYRVRKYLGAYAAAMGGLDAVVFTGGIGQGSAEVRALSLQGLDGLGLRLDPERNRDARGFDEVCPISADDSEAAVLVVPADEERMMAREALRALGRSRIARALEGRERRPFPIEVSPPHLHLSQAHVEALFGRGHRLTRRGDPSPSGRFECEERVAIVGPRGRLEGVAVLGPARKDTQVEISTAAQFRLGVHPPLRRSGDVEGSPGCTLEGPAGSVVLRRGVIRAQRHVHMTPEDALLHGVRDRSLVRVRVTGEGQVILGDVLVTVEPEGALALHLDTDEAEAAGVRAGARGTLEGIEGER